MSFQEYYFKWQLPLGITFGLSLYFSSELFENICRYAFAPKFASEVSTQDPIKLKVATKSNFLFNL